MKSSLLRVIVIIVLRSEIPLKECVGNYDGFAGIMSLTIVIILWRA